MAARKTVARRRTTSPAKKLDLYLAYAHEYVAHKDPFFVRIGRAHYLGIEGRGAPGSPEFTDAIGALYNVAFTIKMAHKFAGNDYAVAKLEGLWWVQLPDRDMFRTPQSRWHWQLMIRIPDFVSSAEVSRTHEQLLARGKPELVQQVKRLTLTEGRCVQVLHTGPYEAESATIERMRAFAELNGLHFRGTHHEIYLSDPRRVAPTKLRTILRMPVGR